MSRQDAPATKGDLDQLKQELSAKIEANTAKIEANAARIDAVDQRLTDVERRLTAKIEANSAALSRISIQVVENSEQIKQLIVTSEEFKGYFHDIIGALDGLAAKFAGLDQERVATNARLDRVEKDVEKNKAEIGKIKAKLGMS